MNGNLLTHTLSYKDESGDLYDYKVGDMPECFKGMKTA